MARHDVDKLVDRWPIKYRQALVHVHDTDAAVIIHLEYHVTTLLVDIVYSVVVNEVHWLRRFSGTHLGSAL